MNVLDKGGHSGPFPLPGPCRHVQHLWNSIAAMPLVANVCTRSTALSNYESSMNKGYVPAKIPSQIRNDDNLPKADDAKASDFVYIGNDLKLCQSTNSEVRENVELPS